jgi:hypothetical protein
LSIVGTKPFCTIGMPKRAPPAKPRPYQVKPAWSSSWSGRVPVNGVRFGHAASIAAGSGAGLEKKSGSARNADGAIEMRAHRTETEMEDGTTKEIERARRNAKRFAEMKRELERQRAESPTPTAREVRTPHVASSWVRG